MISWCRTVEQKQFASQYRNFIRGQAKIKAKGSCLSVDETDQSVKEKEKEEIVCDIPKMIKILTKILT